MNLDSPLDVTPVSTVSTLQFENEIANTIVNAVLITLIIVNINSIVSKLVHLTHKDKFRYSSFLRVFIFHNSDDPALLLSWLRQSSRHKDDPQSQNYKITKSRLFAPIVARIIIFLTTLASIAISIPQDKHLKGCDQGDWYPNFSPQEIQGPPILRPRNGPVCSALEMDSRLGTVRSRANYCACPVIAELGAFANPVIIVKYTPDSGALFSGVSAPSTDGSGQFSLHASDAYVEWIDAGNVNYRSTIRRYETDKHVDLILDAILNANELGASECAKGKKTEKDGFTIVEVTCSFVANETSVVVDAFVRNSLRWQRTGAILERILPNRDFNRVVHCPIDVVVSRPFLNMVPLAALLVMLFTLNLAVGFTTVERGEVLEQTFGLVKEVLGHDSTIGAIERSNDDDREGIEVAERKRWVCSGGDNYHEGFLKGEGCDEVTEFPADGRVRRCKYADGSGRREVNVAEEDGRNTKRNGKKTM